MSSQYRPLDHTPEDMFMSEVDTSYDNGNRLSMGESGHQRGISETSAGGTTSKFIERPSIRPTSSTDSKKDGATPRRTSAVFAIWWKEFIACFLAVAAAIATFATLYPYQGRPLPQWPYLITVNALLSAYMVVLKASATFLLAEGLGQQKWLWFDGAEKPLYDFAVHDEATRGPWGAVKLLTRTSLKHVWHWLGCILILLALFVDPFTQQVLHYSDCNVLEESGMATIPRTNFFAGGGPHAGAGLISITSDEQASINAGMSAPGGHVDVQCTSGNCTYPPFSTIGYCSACQDISDAIQIEWLNYTDINNMSFLGIISYIPDGASVSYVRGPQSNFSTMSILSDNTFQYLVGLPTNGSAGQSAAHPIDPVTEQPPTGCNDAATNGTWRCIGTGAANCTLYPCIRTYNASVRNAALREDLLKETPQLPFIFGNDESVQYFSTLNASCLTDTERDSLQKRGYTINSTTDWIPYNITFSPISNQPQSATNNSTEILNFETTLKQRGCLFSTEVAFVESLTYDYFDYAWAGNLTGVWNMASHGVALFEGPQMLQSLYNYGQFSFERTQSMFRNISESMTNHMRTTPGFEGPDLFSQGAAAVGEVY
ncbi:hypothetical protein M409DRAFT_59621 [Zasmidium cellare ATCC 36951]|uniref:Uncharacterized protein n=1 Tax=Zasmidium cellare ATCC 36951 TaxID=1080233 RepID=A0A6A6C4P0_ZASCE|nr:uncharacterized protein M409DRAFT_59621 [Zasmidium cellare ATCC 36951]KAF2160832.1 hypothetical protein M409DRAFT_59621 [Zasmidium cellare ATCC 36951]